MDSPPMFDFSRHDIWKAKMSSHLKSLRHLVYQATTQESFPNSSKHKKANALALRALRSSLNEFEMSLGANIYQFLLGLGLCEWGVKIT